MTIKTQNSGAAAGMLPASPAAMRSSSALLGSLLAIALTLLSAGCNATSPAPAPGAAALPLASALAAMTQDARDVVRGASVRFLLLPPPYAERAVATSGPHWSALSSRDGELTVSLHGTDTTHDGQLAFAEVQRAQPNRSVRGAAARVLVNEGIRSVAWHERGTDWSLEVECYAPLTDARCTGDAFVLGLAARLEEAPR